MKLKKICINKVDYLKWKTGDEPRPAFEDYGCGTCQGDNTFCANYLPTTVKYDSVKK